MKKIIKSIPFQKIFLNIHRFYNSNSGVFYLGGILGLLLFIVLYGVDILDCTYVDWIYSNVVCRDSCQHYYGWEFFRRGKWLFPIGMTDMLSFPLKSSVIFTDSIPHWAIFFKIFDNYLPEHFQFFGWFVFSCFFFQGAFSALILKKFTAESSFSLIGAFFFVLATPLYVRYFIQTALGAQWLILFSLYMFFFDLEIPYRKMTILWSFILWYASGIHITLLAICCIILFFSICTKIKERGVKCSLLQTIIPVAISVITLFFEGGLTSETNPVISTNNAGGLGYWNLNLNSLFNPVLENNSLIFHSFPVWGEFWNEGYFYIGFGMLLLLVLCPILYIKNKPYYKRMIPKKISKGILFLTICSTIIALSPKIVFGDHLLCEYNPPKYILGVWEIFRASGRFFLPVYYLILIVPIISVYRLLHKSIHRLIVLIIILSIQLFDISYGIKLSCKDFTSPMVKLDQYSPEWDKILSNKETICFSRNFHVITKNELLNLALNHNLKLNTFDFAHEDKQYQDRIKSSAHEEFLLPSNKALYVFVDEDSSFIDSCSSNLMIRELDDILIGTEKRNIR